jgi:hypothetical protein
MPFWKKKMKPQHNVDYVLLDSDDKSKTAVGVKTGKFAGILYHYNKARLTEEEDHARMTFSYTVISTSKIPIEDLIQDAEFQNFIGDILTDILMSQAEANEKIRDNDSEEFDI